MKKLDVDAVKAFVAVAEAGSFTRAADAIGTTQAAISVTLKRLEERVGMRLIERTPRTVRLSATGEAFLDAARDLVASHERAIASLAPARRRVRIGLAIHLAPHDVAALLTCLSRPHPAVAVEFRRESAIALFDAFDRGEVEAVLSYKDETRRGGERLGADNVGWFAKDGFAYRKGEVLPLAASSPSCGLRNVASAALDAARLPYSETFLGCGAFIVADAVEAGLAIAALPYTLAPAGTIEVGQRFGLPSLPPNEIFLHARAFDPAARDVLKTLAAALRDQFDQRTGAAFTPAPTNSARAIPAP